ncbi:hypothetical protein EJ08DRAFT_660949 [Tothia fuscella]|uniref:Uncharacterized protein n=1 Tax=Tothia fuscella TaxID=1048955 RepID=A0A9P4NRY7_9PEZI|nr:hypothetical protein EJ08DRAFT_660949 [Tothia fuscella]
MRLSPPPEETFESLSKEFDLETLDSFNLESPSDADLFADSAPNADPFAFDSEAQQEAAKKKKANGQNGSASASTSPALKLLDPKARGSNQNAASSNASEGQASASKSSKRGTPTGSDSEGQGLASLLEKLHGVEQRAPSSKRRKVVGAAADENDDEKNSKAFDGSIGESGPIGQFFKEAREAAKEKGELDDEQPLLSPVIPGGGVVDLTNEDEDDEVEIVSSNPVTKTDSSDAQQVCLGRIDATISLHLVPTPKAGGHNLQGTATTWPPMKVSLYVEPNQMGLIRIHDPTNRRIGNMDSRTGKALVTLMRESRYEVFLKPRLESRRKVGGEIPGAPTSRTEKMAILVFARRQHVDAIGRRLHQGQIKLENPRENIGLGVELVNPHAPQTTRALPWAQQPGVSAGYTYSTVPQYVTRTVEEATSDVMNMIDTLVKEDDIPEMDQDPRIITELKKHQRQALYFMTKREQEQDLPANGEETETFSLWRYRTRANGQRVYFDVITGTQSLERPKAVRGGLLADLMGLGKTLSILSLVMSTTEEARKFAARTPPRGPGLNFTCNTKGTLLICPLSVVSNWENQIEQHVQPGTLSVHVYHGSNRIQDAKELAKYDFVITSYSTVLNAGINAGIKKPLTSLNWFRIVLDEGHQIRNQTTATFAAVCALSAQRRWSVTATPVQNRFDDIAAQFKFLRIAPFDQKGTFTSQIMNPFKNADPNVLPKFRLLMDSITLRRQKGVVALPPRIDNIVRLDFSATESPIYEHFIHDASRRANALTMGKNLGRKGQTHMFAIVNRMRRICAHGESLLTEADQKLLEGVNSNNAIELYDDDLTKPALTLKMAFEMLEQAQSRQGDVCERCAKKIGSTEDIDDNDYEVSGNTNTIGYMLPCYLMVCPKCLPKFQDEGGQIVDDANIMKCPICDDYHRAVFFELKQSELNEHQEARSRVNGNPKLARQLGFYRGPHTKVLALIQALKVHQAWSDSHPEEEPIKSVVFSEWTDNLDLIQIALVENNFSFTRLDGTMSRNARKAALATFDNDSTVCVILISIKAGGLGLNLTVANKVYVMEPQYNPAAEKQAVDRVHRMGQKREVEINRFIMKGSFEEKVLEMQRKKEQLADMSLNRKMDKADVAAEKMRDMRNLFR